MAKLLYGWGRKRRGRKDRMKIGVNGKISWNKET